MHKRDLNQRTLYRHPQVSLNHKHLLLRKINLNKVLRQHLTFLQTLRSLQHIQETKSAHHNNQRQMRQVRRQLHQKKKQLENLTLTLEIRRKSKSKSRNQQLAVGLARNNQQQILMICQDQAQLIRQLLVINLRTLQTSLMKWVVSTSAIIIVLLPKNFKLLLMIHLALEDPALETHTLQYLLLLYFNHPVIHLASSSQYNSSNSRFINSQSNNSNSKYQKSLSNYFFILLLS